MPNHPFPSDRSIRAPTPQASRVLHAPPRGADLVCSPYGTVRCGTVQLGPDHPIPRQTLGRWLLTFISMLRRHRTMVRSKWGAAKFRVDSSPTPYQMKESGPCKSPYRTISDPLPTHNVSEYAHRYLLHVMQNSFSPSLVGPTWWATETMASWLAGWLA
jgi:hypothetical protein